LPRAGNVRVATVLTAREQNGERRKVRRRAADECRGRVLREALVLALPVAVRVNVCQTGLVVVLAAKVLEAQRGRGRELRRAVRERDLDGHRAEFDVRVRVGAREHHGVHRADHQLHRRAVRVRHALCRQFDRHHHLTRRSVHYHLRRGAWRQRHGLRAIAGKRLHRRRAGSGRERGARVDGRHDWRRNVGCTWRGGVDWRW